MKNKYNVTIKAVIRKTIEVEATSASMAVAMAEELFSPQPDNGISAYTQEVVNVEQQ